MGNETIIIIAIGAVAMALCKLFVEYNRRKKANKEFQDGYVRVETPDGTRYMVARDKDGNPTGEYYQQLVREKGHLKVC
jgi:hypothetical protein